MAQIELYRLLWFIALFVMIQAHFQSHTIRFTNKVKVLYLLATLVQIFLQTTFYLATELTGNQRYINRLHPVILVHILARMAYTYFVYVQYVWRFQCVYSRARKTQKGLAFATALYIILQTVGSIFYAVLLFKSSDINDYIDRLVASKVLKWPDFQNGMNMSDTLFSAILDAVILREVYRCQLRKIVDANRIIRFVLYNGASLLINSVFLTKSYAIAENTQMGLLSNQLVVALTFDFLSMDLPRFRIDMDSRNKQQTPTTRRRAPASDSLVSMGNDDTLENLHEPVRLTTTLRSSFRSYGLVGRLLRSNQPRPTSDPTTDVQQV